LPTLFTKKKNKLNTKINLQVFHNSKLTVLDVRLKHPEGQPPYAFVQYEKKDDAVAAIRVMDQRTYFGEPIKVQGEKDVSLI